MSEPQVIIGTMSYSTIADTPKIASRVPVHPRVNTIAIIRSELVHTISDTTFFTSALTLSYTRMS